MLLAIDTSTLTIGAAVCDADGVLSQASESGTRAHAELLAPAIEEALHAASSRPADLDAVVVGVGPGPFTGLRVGIVTAAVMGHTLDIPVHGVCSLDAIAFEVAAGHRAEVGPDGEFLVATDARRKEVYWAHYRLSDSAVGFTRVSDPAVNKAADLSAELAALPGFGAGPSLYSESLNPAQGPQNVSPAQLGLLGVLALADPTGVGAPILRDEQPLYLRRPDASAPAAPPTR